MLWATSLAVFLLIQSVANAGNAIHNDSVPIEAVLSQARELELYEHPTWHRLLHLQKSGFLKGQSRSNINTRDFFLSGDAYGSALAQAELYATLRYFLARPLAEDKQIPVCRYPARFLWLSRQLDFPDTLSLRDCNEFYEWSTLERLESVSLMFVGSYMGNPASTFGHVLIKFNDSATRGRGDLLDLAVNFGAAVPPNESALMYIAKGLTGGYQAGFSDKNYFEEDLVYSSMEQRDIWEYELRLTEFQRQLLVAHLWELRGKQYDYFFLKQNCGYRIAEILELVTGVQILPAHQQWYAPVSLFSRISEASNPETGMALAKNPIFLPSPQRQIYASFRRLNVSQQEAFKTYLLEQAQGMPMQGLIEVVRNEDTAVLDLLIDYNTQRLGSAEPEFKGQLLQERQLLLQERVRLPAAAQRDQQGTESLESPATGTAPSRWQFSSGEYDQSGHVSRIAFSPFYYDELGRHGQDGSELIFLDTALDYRHDQGDLTLSSIKLLKIQRLDLMTPNFESEHSFSWRLETGISSNPDCFSCLNFGVRGGLGKAHRFSDAVFGYFMTDVFYDGFDDRVGVAPKISLNYSDANHGGALSYTEEVNLNESSHRGIAAAEYRFRLSRNSEIKLIYRDDWDEIWSLSFAVFN